MQIYVVKRKDNIDGIATAYGVTVERIAYDNQIDPPFRLAVGQALLIRSEEEAVGGVSDTIGGIGTAGPRLPLETNGYAYPYIEEEVLGQTLPFLTDLSIFSYGFTAEGSLVAPKEDVEWMIREAMDHGTRPMMVLAPLGADGRFNNELVSALVRNIDAQEKLIREVWAEVQARQYGGVDVDFEYVHAEDRVAYAAFVSRLTRTLNVFGYKVTVAVAPKTSRDQKGQLYEGIDYRLLGEAANQVMLMTYEWGYT